MKGQGSDEPFVLPPACIWLYQANGNDVQNKGPAEKWKTPQSMLERPLFPTVCIWRRPRFCHPDKLVAPGPPLGR